MNSLEEINNLKSMTAEIRSLSRQVTDLKQENERLREKIKWHESYSADANDEIIMLKRHIYFLEKEKNELETRSKKNTGKITLSAGRENGYNEPTGTDRAYNLTGRRPPGPTA